MEAAPLTLFERLEFDSMNNRGYDAPLRGRSCGAQRKARLCDKLREQSTPAGNSCRVHGYRLVNAGALL
jgi:hypothetical protein